MHEGPGSPIDENVKCLYEWNAALAQVIMCEICHFEVALRNAYDHVMCERWDSGSISSTAPA